MVEWKKFGDVCELERGVRVVKKDLRNEGIIPVFQNSLTPLGYFEKSNYPANTPFVICAGAAGEIGFSKIPFWAADDCTCLMCSSSVISKFAYYYLLVKQHSLKSQVRKASVPRLSKNVIEKLLIPVPSLSEQQRIVGILDTFTESIENLKKQIEQRKKQYEYYCDQLLFSNDLNAIASDVSSFAKGRISAEGLNASNYVSVENLLKDKAGKTVSSVVPTEGNWLLYQENDILIGNIRPYLRKIWFADVCGGTNGDVLVIRPNEKVIPRFLYSVFSSERFFNYYNQTAKGGKMPRGEKKRALQFDFYLPSIEEQSRIVAILDKFEASIANLEQQLAQRQKQYEYYRNKLLTFE